MEERETDGKEAVICVGKGRGGGRGGGDMKRWDMSRVISAVQTREGRDGEKVHMDL